MSSNNLSQSEYSPSDLDSPQPLNHGDIKHSPDKSLKNSHNEMHAKRIQSLRKELEYLKATEWKFEYGKGLSQ
ncbi:unnamed protein product [Leptidea sinapis]|uniref:Uncharacterized protein n=1 Tax=Leptidea sinapis TaxID=189913 RepID=A0A5E4QD40_9NEOP|nr:unnamed protein product [Leptidea sinapis]